MTLMCCWTNKLNEHDEFEREQKRDREYQHESEREGERERDRDCDFELEDVLEYKLVNLGTEISKMNSP